MHKFNLNFFKCNLIKSHICGVGSNNKQLHLLTILHKNCIKVYINDILVPKQNIYHVSTYEQTNTIKIKLVGVFNNQTHFLDVKSKSIDVNLPSFISRNTVTNIQAIHKLSHKSIPITCLKRNMELRVLKKMERTLVVNLSKNIKLETEIIKQNYNLISITNNYEQTNLSNT